MNFLYVFCGPVAETFQFLFSLHIHYQLFPSVHTPLYARIWLHVHVFIVNRSILFSQSGRGTPLQYHKGQWLFSYCQCIRDRTMNCRAHKSMRIYKSRWYTRAKAGAAPYPKDLKTIVRCIYTNISMLCTSALLPPWRSQKAQPNS